MTTTFLVLIACGIAWAVTHAVIRNAPTLGLVAEPNHRSSHSRPTPNGGGLGIAVAGTICGGALLVVQPGQAVGVLLVLSGLMAAVGLRDDVRPLSAGFRLAVQILACGVLLGTAAWLVPGGGSSLSLLFALLVWGTFLFVGVAWLNLFNFMDGIDGIAGLQALFMLTAAASIAALPGAAPWSDPTWIWMVCVAAAVLGFLMHNWPPAKIFMGDAGSLYVGFMVFGLAALSIEAGWLEPMVWVILGAVFVSDAAVTLGRRLLARERFWEAHRSHLYQRLSRRWGGHLPVTVLSLAVNILWIAPLAAAAQINPSLGLAFAAAAYAPLIVGCIAGGAGCREQASDQASAISER